MKRVCIIITLSIFIINCKAQEPGPLALTKKIFSRGSSTDSSKYITGEYKAHPNGNDLPHSIKPSFRLLDEDAISAVVNITLTDSTGQQLDTYLYFIKDKSNVWKASAFRALAMTGIIGAVNQQLKSLSGAQVDSIIHLPPDKNGIDHRDFKTRDEYNFMLGNTTLVLAPDDTLIAHFKKNKALFNSIKDGLIAKGIMKTTDGTISMKDIDNIKAQMHSIFIDEVMPDNESSTNNLKFMIGGVLDNTVGYMYIKDKNDVPGMSSSLFILVRKIGDGWYLFKTT